MRIVEVLPGAVTVVLGSDLMNEWVKGSKANWGLLLKNIVIHFKMTFKH